MFLVKLFWTVSKILLPKPLKIHTCLYISKAARHMAEQTKAPLTELHQSVSWFESKFCYSLSFREFQQSGILTHYSVDSIKRTVLLKVLFGTLSIKCTIFNSYFKKISIKNTVYQEKEVREKLNVRYV